MQSRGIRPLAEAPIFSTYAQPSSNTLTTRTKSPGVTANSSSSEGANGRLIVSTGANSEFRLGAELEALGSLNGLAELAPRSLTADDAVNKPACFGVRVRPESAAGEFGVERESQSVSLSSLGPGGLGNMKLSDGENGRTDMGVVASGGGAGIPGTSRY